MKNPNRYFALAAAVVGLVSLPLTASASSETFSYTAPTTTVGTPLNFTLSGFDTNLGTLTGVSLSLNLSTSVTPQVLNLSGAPGAYSDAYTGYTVTLAGPDGTTVVDNVNSAHQQGTIAAGAPFSVTSLTPSSGSFSGLEGVPVANLASYDGSSLSFQLGAPTLTSGGSPTQGSLAFGGTGSFGGTVSVQYDYIAAPEPATYAFALVGGLVMLVALRRGKLAVL